MRYLVKTDRNGVPRVFDTIYEGYFNTTDAVNAYIAEQKLERNDLLRQINLRMSRLASTERKIRMAGKLGDT